MAAANAKIQKFILKLGNSKIQFFYLSNAITIFSLSNLHILRAKMLSSVCFTVI